MTCLDEDVTSPRPLALACLAFLDAEPEAHITAAASAGFGHVTLRVTGSSDPVPAQIGLDPHRLSRVAAALEASHVGVLDVEVVRLGAASDPSHVARVLEVAAALRARHLLVVNSGLERAEATDRLGQIVEQAAGSGVQPCLEPMRFSRCRNLAEAVATAVPAGAGVLIDALHLFRAGDGALAVADAVRTHGAGLFPYVQVCDAAARAPGDDSGLREEAVRGRLLPGHGVLPVSAMLAQLPSDLPLAVEAPTRVHARLSPELRAVASMRAVVDLLRRTSR